MGYIYIRNVDEELILKIDRLARKKGQSRSAYIRDMIQSHCIIDEIKSTESKYESIIEKLMFVISENTAALNEVVSKNEVN